MTSLLKWGQRLAPLGALHDLPGACHGVWLTVVMPVRLQLRETREASEKERTFCVTYMNLS